MYADETHITCVGADISSFQLNLNRDLDNLNKWLNGFYQTYYDYHENRIYADWLQIKNEYFIKPT